MARRDDDEFDHDDDRPRKGKSAFPVWLIVLLCAVPLGLIVVVGGGIALFWARATPAQQADAQPQLVDDRMSVAVKERLAKQPTLLSKKEFESLVLNKSGNDLIKSVGRPDETTENVQRPPPPVISFLAEYWLYRNRVMNEATGKPYPVARLYIDAAKNCYRIDYP